jgi:Spy/CpxP family protein refolding chaperone
MPPGAAREEAGRMVDAYVLSNLQESLGLSDDQFVKLLPLVKRLQAERRETMERRSRALREMRRLLKSGSATEPEVLAQLKEFKAIETDEPARGRKDMEAIDGLLTPLQQAKFRVFEAEVGQKLRELMGQMRRQNRADSRPDPAKARRPD